MISGHPGPLIGIMTARNANGSIAGNGPLFIALQKKLISLDGISFVFTAEEVNEDYIDGYSYLPDKKNWIKAKFPYPDLVYNRIPFRKSEQDVHCQKFFSLLKEKQIPFFNPCFIDKYEFYDLLKNHELLHSFLPQTILVKQKKDLFSFLEKHKSIYVKQTQSSRGKGVYRLKLIESLQIQLEGLNIRETYQSFHHFWDEWNGQLLERDYLAQEEVKSAEYEGNRFDFRILAHAANDDYLLTGVGIRQSQNQGITTHIPAGGRLLPYELLQSSAHDQFIQTVVPQIGKSLSKQFGYFGEFSIDAGVSKSGDYYIYEVNSKPMSFDEPGIEERKIEQLCRLFLKLAELD
ncbi:YheC/YheD family endospore coat-associated protein [Neobacillus soli]|uniref:YheC/YheD family endospore coat-associated protein n=1 Tax=Neobacillus soli TaxID=220688 RepID=UPI000824479C|nr:YheC/YheD family protein [Neobacillus soli]